MSSSVTRILIVTGSMVGAITGAFLAITKILPERAKIIIGYQVEAITSLQEENKRLSELVAYLEKELAEVRLLTEKNSEEISYHV